MMKTEVREANGFSAWVETRTVKDSSIVAMEAFLKEANENNRATITAKGYIDGYSFTPNYFAGDEDVVEVYVDDVLIWKKKF